MYGYSEIELEQMYLADFHPKDSLDHVMSEFDLQRRGEKALAPELPCLRKDGTVFYADVAATAIIINHRECVVGFFADVTDRKALEDELRKAYDDLKNAQAQLVQTGKLASIGELAAGVAHELNQPLMVIRATAQYTLRKQRKNSLDAAALLEDLDVIEKNTKRMMNIINHLRTFSRQTTGEFAPVDVNRIIQDSFTMLGQQLRLRNIEIKMELSPGLPKVRGDTTQLEQVFLNLLTNARDAIGLRIADFGLRNGENGKTIDEGRLTKDEGGARIEIVTRAINGGEQPEIGNLQPATRNAQPATRYVEITVTDNGCGIPADKVDRIFDPFFTTKEVGKGTGLGLSISYGIIKDHGGEIEVAETGAEGTTFRITLPVE